MQPQMQLNFQLYKDEELILDYQQVEYCFVDNSIVFTCDNNEYTCTINPNNFQFQKNNSESLFSIDYLKKEYQYLLKFNDSYLNFKCLFQEYRYLPTKIEYTYQLETEPNINKIIIEL